MFLSLQVPLWLLKGRRSLSPELSLCCPGWKPQKQVRVPVFVFSLFCCKEAGAALRFSWGGCSASLCTEHGSEVCFPVTYISENASLSSFLVLGGLVMLALAFPGVLELLTVPFSEADIPGKVMPFTSSSTLCLSPAGLVRTPASTSRFPGNS